MKYLWDNQSNLFRCADPAEFAYSDGLEVESRLLELVSRAQDRSTFSPELAAGITDWPTEYHLSRARHCLVRPLGLRPEHKVLELGCGCGAITRFLGEIGAHVVGVEGSLPRAKVAAERCRDLGNVQVVVDDLLQFETDERFDFILLIGVLEYAAVFSAEQEPFGHYLRSLSRFLAPAGRVVVAIENQLGLKYFNGCGEDHVGVPFFGIQDLYGARTVRTFGKKELIAQLSGAGLAHTYFYYPFPDYKLPSVILTETGLADREFEAVDLLARAHGRDYAGFPYRNFDDALAFSVVASNGLLAELSNSFLVVAVAEPAFKPDASELASAFSIQRAPEFCTQTRFVRDESTIRVVKEPLTALPAHLVQLPGGITISHHADESAYHRGRQVQWKLLKARARSGDLQAVGQALRPWIEFLLQHARVPAARVVDVSRKPSKLASYEISGRFLDCTPANLLDTGDEFAPIDLEWQSDRDISLGWVVTRGVLWSLGWGVPSASNLESVSAVVEALCQDSGLSVSESEVQDWLDLEAVFQTSVTERPCEHEAIQRTSGEMRSFRSHIANLEQDVVQRNDRIIGLNQLVADRETQIRALEHVVLQTNEQIGVRNQEIAGLNQQIAGLNQQITSRGQQMAQAQAERDGFRAEASDAKAQLTARSEQLDSLLHSKAWRLTSPLRAAGKLKPSYYRDLRRLRMDSQLVAASGLFDAKWYLSHNLDVAISRQDPLVHYLQRGGMEGRDPSQGFSSRWYLEENADVRATGLNPLVHYLRFGIGEGRKPIPGFLHSLPEAKKHWEELGHNRLRQIFGSKDRVVLPATDTPVLSIILVFYNKVHLSLLCLDSILNNADVAYEVVIVNNCSIDETGRLLERVDGAIIINNRVNLGFGEACVQGAEQARGEYLCFLNNDALLQAHSLSAALDNFREDSKVGAVGGKILLANGTLQEAGSILWSDGSALGYGRGEDPNLPQYEFRRPVDYCSGAFLFTPLDLFRRLGGFNRSFSPAYYEDADYCMQVWNSGLRVIYEPRAVIRHYESASSGGNEAARPAMAANQHKFRERWKGQLPKHLPNSPVNVLSARVSSSSGGLKILYIDDRIPHRYLGAGFPRSVEILSSLVKQGHHVTCSSFTLPFQENEYSDIPRDVELLDGFRNRDRLFREYVPHSDIVWVSRPHNMKAFLQERNMGMRSGRARLIYDAEAIFAERDWLQGKTLDRQLPENALAASLSEETSLAKSADAVVVVTQKDGATLARAGVKKVYVVGHYLDPRPSPAGFADRRAFLFVGAMHGNDNPNADSMRYFCEAIWPAIHSFTGSNLIIAGYGTREALADLRVDGVHILGLQNDLSGLYNEARVFIVPTRYAAGIPLKAYEAAAFGVPLVVSGLIGKQLGWEHGKHCLIADDPTSFAEDCCRAYEEQELWERLRSNGLERVKSELNEEIFRQGISETISAVGAYHGRPQFPV